MSLISPQGIALGLKRIARKRAKYRENMGRASEDGIGTEPAARQDTTTSEKHEFNEKDVETAQTGRNGSTTHIDEVVAERIAANVDDFMVCAPSDHLFSWIGVCW